MTDLDKEIDSLCEDEYDLEWYDMYLSSYYNWNWLDDNDSTFNSNWLDNCIPL